MLWLLLLLVACDVPYDVPRVPVDAGPYVPPEEGWERAREDLVQARACLADVPVYCLLDDERIDEAIQADLDQHHHGLMPTNERWLTEHIGRARAEWNNTMKRDQQLVEDRVKENWRDPKVEMVRGRADVYLHVPPCDLRLRFGKWKGRSTLVKRGELTTEVLVNQLTQWKQERPRANVIRLIVDVPQEPKGFDRMDIRWYVDRDEVVIYRPRSKVAWTTGAEADLQAYADGELSLHTSELMACPVKRVGAEPRCDDVAGGASRGRKGKSKGKAKSRGKAKSKGKAKGKTKGRRGKSKG